MAAFGVASVLTIPFLGLLTDRVGRGGAMLWANVLMALAAAGFAPVQSAGSRRSSCAGCTGWLGR